MTLPPWLSDTWHLLADRLSRKVLPHALLICGDAGLGKRALADELAASILCQERDAEGHACGTCRSCRLLVAGSHPDRIFVSFGLRDDGKPRSEIIIEQIRALSQRLSLSSQFGGMQVVLIDPADKMNTSAANALLKTLEEPSQSTIIVLVSDAPSRLPATIRSRCQRIDVHTPPRAIAMDWLLAGGVSPDSAAEGLAAALGNPGKAMRAINDDSVKLRGECRKDLIALRNRRCSALVLADAWSADRPAERLWHVAALVRDEALALAGGGRGAFGLTGADEIPKLVSWFAATNRSRELLDTQVRSELVLLDLLRTWQLPRST